MGDCPGSLRLELRAALTTFLAGALVIAGVCVATPRAAPQVPAASDAIEQKLSPVELPRRRDGRWQWPRFAEVDP